MSKRRVQYLAALAAGVAAMAGQATAQESGWDWSFTPYLWGAGIDGRAAIGSIGRDIDTDFSDIVDVLAGAALFRVEGGNDEHGLIGDVVWMRLEPDDDIATVGGTASAEFDTLMMDVGYLRKLDALDIELGARYWDFELELDPALLASVKRDDSWVDGYIGVRFERPIGNDWLWQARLNAGAGGSDATYGAELHFARELKSGNRFVLGFKALDVDYTEESVGGLPFTIDTTFYGATVGYTFE